VVKLDIHEVEEILGMYRALKAPKHIIVTEEPVRQQLNGDIFYRGLAPKWRRDVIVLTPQAIPETVVHENLHANFGLGEEITYPLARLLIVKYNIIQLFPRLKRLLVRPVKYELCQGCEEFAELHTKYQGRALHFRRVI